MCYSIINSRGILSAEKFKPKGIFYFGLIFRAYIRLKEHTIKKEVNLKRKVDVIEDLDGKRTVFIHDILFKGKRAVKWEEVEQYLCQYVGEFYQIEACNKMVYIGADLPDEFTHSNYTRILKGANAKAKANAAQGLPELLKIAANEVYKDNRKEKHRKDAKYGWYSYDSRFALPVFGDNGEIERYNVFNVVMLVRHDANGKCYLYDIMKIKKETSTLFQSNDFTQ